MSYGGELVVDAGEPIRGLRLGLGVAFGALGGLGGLGRGFLRPGKGAEVRDFGGVETVVVLTPAPTNEPIANRTAGDDAGGRLAGRAGHFAASLSCSHAFR